MATILFSAVGAGLGGFFGPVGAVLGRAAGALVGNAVDQALIGGTRTVSGARLGTARIGGAAEGTAITSVYGTMRIGGTLIWATRFEEEATVERRGGKATGGSRVETFRYFGNLALGLCEGPIAGVRRVWADGRELDLTTIEMRVYPGSEDQLSDPLIEAKQGTGRAPAYRGLAYVVFERLPLEPFGNRIPVMQFEIMRPVGQLEGRIRAITMIPGATEHGYATTTISEATGAGSARLINRNTLATATDWQTAMDELQALCPNLEHVALVVAWFGTDLRAGSCHIRPGVETLHREAESRPWRVCGMNRASAHLVSSDGGGPAFGGTPDDASVFEAIVDLKARGLKVTLYPFVMMDIPAGNGLPDPYGGTEQAAYPWRGRVTCHPAPGRPGTADLTSAAVAQIATFCGTATASDFVPDGISVAHPGDDEGYRRMVLHYALLAEAAGGVDAFLIGSELRGLTTVRDPDHGFPFVSALTELAADVRAVLRPATRITYGADWSEYFGYQPDDGSGNVYFHLDPLWASPDIDAVGIDNYMPLSDWRDEDLTAANPDGFRTIDDPLALRSQIEAGEGFDWYYASEADRSARSRTPITDGAAGKPWVFRYKDIEAWWSNSHIERRGGVELSSPTAWLPGMKPVWFTELGCPAVDKGANQPNVFPDPKSAENALPYFSGGGRAASLQRRFLDAHLDHWQAMAGNGMVDTDRIYLWSFDTRPYPAFPGNRDLWRDGDNWKTGHWLNGRLGGGTLADILSAIMRDHGFHEFDVSEVSGDLAGYVKADVGSARALIEPLLAAFLVDVRERDGKLVFRSRDRASLAARAIEVVADLDDEPRWREIRGHDSDFADEATLTFLDAARDYGEASVRSRRLASGENRVLAQNLAAALDEETAIATVEAMLRDHRVSRRNLEFAISPAELAPEPGDVLTFDGGPQGRFLLTRIEEGAVRRLFLREIGAALPGMAGTGDGGQSKDNRAAHGFAPVLHLLDLPGFEPGATETFARAAVLTRPWRRVALSSSGEGEAYRFRVTLDRPAKIGLLTAELRPGVSGRIDRANSVEVELLFGELSSVGQPALLDGFNRLAVKAASGALEVLGYAEAEETAPNRWRLTGLLRGLAGTEDATAAGSAEGADVVILDGAVKPLGLAPEEAGRSLLWLAEQVGGATAPASPLAFAGGVRAQTPLAPVHLRGVRTIDGAVSFSWVRRGRLDADGWEASDIPLDEAEERYRLEILSGDTVLRIVEPAAPWFLYSPDEELADFGAPQAAIAIRVRQLGRKVPLGLPAKAVLTF